MAEPPLRRSVFRIYAPSVLYAVGVGAILPVVPLTARDLGAGLALAALVVTLVGAGGLLANLPAAVLTDRYGERVAMVAAAGWAALGMVAALAAPAAGAAGLALFSLGVLMVGMAGSVFNLARQSYLTVAVPLAYRARAMSGLGGSIRVGTFAGPFAAAGAMALWGISGAYWTGLAALAAAAVVCLRIPELAAPAGATAPAPAAGFRGTARAHRRVFATLGTAVVLLSAVRAARQAVIPLWCGQLGLDPSAASLVYGLAGAVDLLVFYPAGHLMDTRGRAWVAVPCMATMGLALVLMPWAAGVPALVAAAMLLGFGNGIGSGIVMTLGADHSPEAGRAAFLGLWRLQADAGTMAGPVLLSAATAAASLAAGTWAVAAVAFLGAAGFAYWIPRSGPPASR